MTRLAHAAGAHGAAWRQIQSLYRRARAIGRFVGLWCHARLTGAASQLAAAERFTWPLPGPAADPCELMHAILRWEDDEREHRQDRAGRPAGPPH